MPSQFEKKLQNRMLNRLGLPTHDNPSGFIELFARAIENHDDFRRFLVTCEPRQRYDMYESLRPHLKFNAYALDVYMAQAAQEAEAKQLPIWDGERLLGYVPFEMRTLLKLSIPTEGLTAERLQQAFKYFMRDVPEEFLNYAIYKIHIVHVNGVERMQFSAGVYENGEALRIQ